jgi:hypothetical protein
VVAWADIPRDYVLEESAPKPAEAGHDDMAGMTHQAGDHQ